MLFQCWSSAVGDGPILKQHWVKSSRLLGSTQVSVYTHTSPTIIFSPADQGTFSKTASQSQAYYNTYNYERGTYDVNHLHILTCEGAVSRVGSVLDGMPAWHCVSRIRAGCYMKDHEAYLTSDKMAAKRPIITAQFEHWIVNFFLSVTLKMYQSDVGAQTLSRYIVSFLFNKDLSVTSDYVSWTTISWALKAFLLIRCLLWLYSRQGITTCHTSQHYFWIIIINQISSYWWKSRYYLILYCVIPRRLPPWS